MMIATVARSGSGCSMTTAGSNSMPTDTKNRTEGIAKRQRLFSRAAAEWRLAQDHARKECAQGKGNVENKGRSEERRGGKECVSKRRSRWSPYPSKKHKLNPPLRENTSVH